MTSPEPITEQRRPEHADLDLRTTRELVELINDEDSRVAPAVRRAAEQLAAAIDGIVARLRGGGRLVYAGAGTSGRLAHVDAAECGPTFGVAKELVTALVAGGVETGAPDDVEDDPRAGEADVRAAGVGAADAVVVLSASGSTPYSVGAARAARATGALVVGVCCSTGSELGQVADHEIVVAVGPEVLAGSTRLKAGTAQKLVLNTISTVAMVQLGRTFGNLMVDVVPGNDKLRRRAQRAVSAATGASDDESAAILAAAAGDVRVAIVSTLADVEPEAARDRLQAAGGSIRGALAG